MTHWLLDQLHDSRKEALRQAGQHQVYRELAKSLPHDIDFPFLHRTAEALELVVLDLAQDYAHASQFKDTIRDCAADAFRLFRVLPRLEDPLRDGIQVLRMSCLGVIGDMGADAARFLREEPWPNLPLSSAEWRERTWATILDAWLRLIRKQGWQDRDAVLERIAALRRAQQEFEESYLTQQPPLAAKVAALEMIGLYHLAKTAEVFAYFITEGVVEGNYQVKQLVDSHFDRVFAVCKHASLPELEMLARLLAVFCYINY